MEDLLEGLAMEQLKSMACELRADAALSLQQTRSQLPTAGVRLALGRRGPQHIPARPHHEPLLPPIEDAPPGGDLGVVSCALQQAIASEVRRAVAEEAERLREALRSCVDHVLHLDVLSSPRFLGGSSSVGSGPLDRSNVESGPLDENSPSSPACSEFYVGPPDPRKNLDEILQSPPSCLERHELECSRKNLDRKISTRLQTIIARCDELSETTWDAIKWHDGMAMPAAAGLAFKEANVPHGDVSTTVEELVRHTAAVVELESQARHKLELKVMTDMCKVKRDVLHHVTQLFKAFDTCWPFAAHSTPADDTWRV